MLKCSISSIVFLSFLKDHLFQESSFNNRGLNVEHPGKRRFDVIRKGRLYIETPVSFLDLSIMLKTGESHMLISLIYFCCWRSHLEGGVKLTPQFHTFTSQSPPGYQTLQPSVGWWRPTQPSDHWFWSGGVGREAAAFRKNWSQQLAVVVIKYTIILFFGMVLFCLMRTICQSC